VFGFLYQVKERTPYVETTSVRLSVGVSVDRCQRWPGTASDWLAVSVQAWAPSWLRIGLQRVKCNQQVILTDPLFQEQTQYLSNVECLKNCERWLPYDTVNFLEGNELKGDWNAPTRGTEMLLRAGGFESCGTWHCVVSCEGSLCCHRHEEWTNLRLEFKAKLSFETSEARGHVPEDWATQLWQI
jgi:hypothetical protein